MLQQMKLKIDIVVAKKKRQKRQNTGAIHQIIWFFFKVNLLVFLKIEVFC